MFSRFFIDRPIFAAVLSIVITLAGAVSIQSLPMAQYPQITPPTIQVMCTYPGASAQVVAETVAAPIEQQVNGVEDMMYMSSQSTNDGAYNLSVTFKPGVNLNFAQVLVQNRVNLALPSLPDVVKQAGVTTRKRSPDILLVVTLYSPDGRYDQLYLSNYLLSQVREEMQRVDGVGDVFIFGQRDYSMRIWVDPDKLAARGLTAGDVANAVSDQNQQVPAGQLGQPPAYRGQQFQYPIATLGRLREVDQFAQIAVKTLPDGRRVTISDIGRVELASKNEDISARLDGTPCSSLAVFQLPDANALDTADRIRVKMEELKSGFPVGVDYEIAYDTTPFIRESINEVYSTLIDAVLLVALVVMLFLQNWRSALIPLVAVPVAIIGTFGVMAVMGFSINNLTLFGLVLAIGIVVDDAIVVVEAVEHHIEHGLAPRAAALKAMSEVSGPVVAVALVLSAVFVPCAFISGITGMFFRQFALTIAVSTVISAFNSLTLSPALSALLLKPRAAGAGYDEALPRWGYALGCAGLLFWLFGPDLSAGWAAALGDPWAWLRTAATVLPGLVAGWFAGVPLDWLLRGFFRLFNLGFRATTSVYTRLVRKTLRGGAVVLMLLLYFVLLGTTATGFQGLPKPLAAFAVAKVDAYRHYALNWRDILAAGQDWNGLARAALPGVVAGLLLCVPLDYLLRRRLRWFRLGRQVGPAARAVLLRLPLYAGVVALTLAGSFVILRSADIRKIGTWDIESGLPTGYIPQQDKGYLLIAVQLPDSASTDRTDRVVARIDYLIHDELVPVDSLKERVKGRAPTDEERRQFRQEAVDRGAIQLDDRANAWLLKGSKGVERRDGEEVLILDPIHDELLREETRAGVYHTISVSGQSFSLGANGSNFGNFFLPLQSFHERRDPSLHSDRIAERLKADFAKYVPEANFAVFGPPAVNGLGTSNGFKIIVEDRGGGGDLRRLQDETEKLIDRGKKERKLTSLFTVYRANSPQLYADVNRKQCSVLGLDLKDVFDTLQIYLGSLYVNDFNFMGRTWQVIIQAEAGARMDTETVKRHQVRNGSNKMVPLGAVCQLKPQNGPLILTRYNMYPAAAITGNTAEGVSSGEGIALMEEMSKQELPADMAFEWTELSYIQVTSGNTAWVLFCLAVLLVFLVLAALYESWSLPLAVILVVPMCLLGSIAGVAITRSDVNIFTQIGFVVLVGLASKNAILIVEFAKVKHEQGKPLREATLEACQLRLRPILMTSFAFILGVVPLMVAHGAGAEMRRVLGTAVFSGMLGVTLFGIFLTPVFFYVIERLTSGRRLFRLPWQAPVRAAMQAVGQRLFNGGRRRPPEPPPSAGIQLPPEDGS